MKSLLRNRFLSRSGPFVTRDKAITRMGRSLALLVAMTASAIGQTVSFDTTVPSSDILAENAATPLTSSQSTFAYRNADAAGTEGTRGRGNTFAIATGTGATYDISAISVGIAGARTFPAGSTLTLDVFELETTNPDTLTGWLAGDGNLDGDILDGTGLTSLTSTTIGVSGSVAGNSVLHFNFTGSELQFEDGKAYGFFVQYKIPSVAGLTADVTLPFDTTVNVGPAGSLLSSYNTDNLASTTRDLKFYVQGTPNIPTGTVVLSGTAPTTDILASNNSGGTFTRLFDEDRNANHARGQLFSLPNGSGSDYEISSVTVQKNDDQTFDNDTLTLRLFEGDQMQWDAGNGHSTGANGSDYYVDTLVTPLHTETFNLNGLISNGDYVTFQLQSPVMVNEDSDFGFLMTYDESTDGAGGSSPDYFQHNEGGAGERISITTTNHGTSGDRHIRYLVQGTATGVAEDLELASPFQDRMVLQRDKPINVWGKALPSTAVSVNINGINVGGSSDENGDWKIELPSMSAGGPYQLVVTSGLETATVNDVLVGDVWFCFGQSNMVYRLNQMQSWADAYESAIAANDNVRCLKIDQNGALGEEESAGMTWLDNVDSDTWSAVGSVFALKLHEATNVPVAIVWAAWGSSSIEGWMPLELSDQFPHFDEMLELYQSVPEYRNGESTSSRLPTGYSTNEEGIAGLSANGWSSTDDDIFMRTRPNIIYNKMVHPMRNFGISGFIWYQGEANAGAPDYSQYAFTLPKFVTEYRKRFGQGDLPFLGVQLPSYNGTYWPWFRESQDQLRTVNDGHVAVTIDTGIAGNIHPADTSKEKTGERLALLARKYALSEAIDADSPRFDSMSIDGNQASITFTDAAGLTTDDGMSPAEFELAGSDEVFYAATSASISGSDVLLSSTSVPTPVAVRYAWSPAPVADVNLVNGAGLPAAPFRTDTFALPGIGAEAPESVDDAYEVAQNTVLNVAAGGVLTNDIDLNQDALTAALVSDVSDGTLSLLPDGSFSYTPHSGFAGTDSFTYECSDGGLTSSVATVTITVTGAQTGYYTWRSGIAWNPGDDETETGDPDLDGVVNLMEYALMLDPLVSDPSGLPTLTPSGADFVYDFNNAREGVLYEVLLSPDLVAWGDPAFASVTSESSMPVLIPSSEGVDGKLFIRLQVSEP